MKRQFLKYVSSLLSLTLVVVLFISCKSAESASSDTPDPSLEQAMTTLSDRSYRVEVDAVYPFNTTATTQVFNALIMPWTGDNAARINVTGEGYYMDVRGDSVVANLPFFGERRFAGGDYLIGRAEVGIKFEGLHEEYEVKEHRKKKFAIAKFEAENLTEDYNVTLNLFRNGNVEVTINSSHRTTISYRGRVVSIEEGVSEQ